MVVSAMSASAQTIGTFRWQQQPYCNVITLNVVQAGTIFQLDGFDDQCGASTRAAVSGLAFLNPNGTVGMGLTIVTTPGGTPTHVDATILVSTVSGTWRDASGTTGDWTLRPGPSSGGTPRPAMRPVFAQGLSAGVRGDSAADVGVYGLTDAGFGVAGGAQTGGGVQGYGVAGESIGVQAVSVGGGAALNIHNGALTVSGVVRTAFIQTWPVPNYCSPLIIRSSTVIQTHSSS